MIWSYDFRGTWEASSSRLGEDGEELFWVIGVCDDGTFDVSESHAALTDRRETFQTFSAAKAYCETAEYCSSVLDSPTIRPSHPGMIYEDELPDSYDYEGGFAHSQVIDGVRMFPSKW